jgi:hypothetical protein
MEVDFMEKLINKFNSINQSLKSDQSQLEQGN